MDKRKKNLIVGDQVRAARRAEFPTGVIVQLLDDGFLLVRWQGDLLETVHCDDVEALGT